MTRPPRPLLAAALATLASACVAPGEVAPAPGQVAAPPPRPYSTLGLERVMGQNARALSGLFGAADADVTEGTARKLQFGSRICVLDAYLYPRTGGGEAVVTHVDARQRDGSTIDRASCVAALARRDGGR